jgi:hypothetical protein
MFLETAKQFETAVRVFRENKTNFASFRETKQKKWKISGNVAYQWKIAEQDAMVQRI